MNDLLKRLGIEPVNSGAWLNDALQSTGKGVVHSVNPTTGEPLAAIQMAGLADYETVVSASQAAFSDWRMLPAPKRGEIIRQIADALREKKDDLGRLITLEVGKIYQEGLGEVQESIDIADFCVGLSRQLYGLTMHSERDHHRMYEQWHPLGPIGVITAFNFPNAVWSWNALIAMACGDTVIWKPSLKAPLTAIATHRIVAKVLAANGWDGVCGLIIGHDAEIGEALINDKRLPLISATGSTRMGRHVNQAVAGRLGRCLLELGGNNALIVDKTADLDVALRGVLFGAVGTAGQRCTSTRRLFLHRDIAASFLDKLLSAYPQISVGDPMEEGTLMGPLIDADAVSMYETAIEEIRAQGGEILCGAKRIGERGYFVAPTLVKANADLPIVQEETFAPILYVFEWDDFDRTMAQHNDVPQGLSSSIFTDSFRLAERFLSHEGSDCGIANVNIGTSGAEIGGAFGGEKDTGGGRESGSDSWRAYMRRQTCTLNWGDELPLAQGIEFNLGG